MNQELTQAFWNLCLDKIRESGRLLETACVEDSPEVAAEASQYLLMTLGAAYTLASRADPDYPEFLPWFNHVYPYGGTNPDATYYYCAIKDSGSYRISGYRNSVNWIDLMIGADYWGFADRPGPSISNRELDEFDINADGSFEILLSAARPDGHSGNWMILEPTANYLMVRQFASDPGEVDARMAIERLDPVPPQRLWDAAQTTRRIDEIIRHLRNSSKGWPSFPGRVKDYVNRLWAASYGRSGEAFGQLYHQGLYKIGLDEALVIEFKVPQKCRYWNIQLADRFWRTLEFINRRTTLNNSQDRSDSDGITRLVVAHRDPGVANWLDACGVTEGDIVMRWLQVDVQPEPLLKLVSLAELSKHLPADTRYVTSEERARDLQAWRVAKQLRRSW